MPSRNPYRYPGVFLAMQGVVCLYWWYTGDHNNHNNNHNYPTPLFAPVNHSNNNNNNHNHNNNNHNHHKLREFSIISPADDYGLKEESTKGTLIKRINNSPSAPAPWKTVLLWTGWFGRDWSGRYGALTGTGLQREGCPSWHCHFTYDRNYTAIADAILFDAGPLWVDSQPHPRPPDQRWVWVNSEAPISSFGVQRFKRLRENHWDPFINWTMTYHSTSDIVAYYGYFTSLEQTLGRPLQPQLMSNHGETLTHYLQALKEDLTLADVMGPQWSTFVRKPRVLAWMSSHCPTNSRREQYVVELQKYMTVETYGRCGERVCQDHFAPLKTCWEAELGANYSFYLAAENNFCDDYITEKVYNPLVHNMVPVVYGAGNYSQYLPPHSYINARHYHPKDLARLLLRLHQNHVEYGRYHLWRGFWMAHKGGSMCELCHHLHTTSSSTSSHYTDIGRWFRRVGKCQRTPRFLFNSPRHPDAWQSVINSPHGEA